MIELLRHPHAPCREVHSVTVNATRTPEGKLALHYAIHGRIAALSIPAPGPARVGWKLWRHTCCELFVREKGAQAYHEFNFSPSGEWAVYAFTKYREGATRTDQDLNPQVAVQPSAARLDLYALVDLARVSPTYARARLTLGLAVIIEEAIGSLSYWALTHSSDKPDFHRAGAFALELDAVRD